MATHTGLRHSGLQSSSKEKGALVILQLNCNSILARLSELRKYIYSVKPDVFCLCESRLPASATEPHFVGYQSVWCHRPARDGGGLGILIRNDVPFSVNTLVPYSPTSKFETLSVRLCTSIGMLDILNVYNPCCDVLLAEINHFTLQLSELNVIVGDFNAHSPLWDERDRSNVTGRSLENFLDQHSHGLLNEYYVPTYMTNRTGATSCLDLCIPVNRLLGLGSFSVGPDIGSDHLPVCCKFNIALTKYSVLGPPRWDLKRANWVGWHIDLSTSQFGMALPATATALNDDLCSRIDAVSRNNVPLTSGSRVRHRRTPWWDTECSKAVAHRRRARNILSRSPTLANLIEYKRLTAVARHIIKSKKKQSWRRYVSKLGFDTPVGQVWQTIRSMNGISRSPPICPVAGPEAPLALKAQFLLEHFCPPFVPLRGPHAELVGGEVASWCSRDVIETPYNAPFTLLELRRCIGLLQFTSPGHDNINNVFLCKFPLAILSQILYVFNMSFFRSEVPRAWKLGIICPIPKPKKNPLAVTGYRPITLLSCLGKLMERVIKYRLDHFLESHSVFTCYQTGFRRGRSTIDALVLLRHFIHDGMSRGSCCAVVYLDLAQAYDCVWHQGVLYKLKTLGCDLRTLLWLRSWLEERTVKVRVGTAFSETRCFKRGLPQGAVLSPILFNVMLSDLPTSPHVRVVSYADDITLVSSGASPDRVRQHMADFLNDLTSWFTKWDLKLNPAKSSYQVFTRARRVPSLHLEVSGHVLQYVERQRVLGVTFDAPKLTLAPHINAVRVECLRRVNVLRALASQRWGSSRDLLRSVYLAFIRSKILYGSPVYPDFPKNVIQRLSVVQNSALRCVLGARKTSPIFSLEVEGYVMPLDIQIQYSYLKWCLRQSCARQDSADLAGVVKLFSSPPAGYFSARRAQLERVADAPAVLRGGPSDYVSPVPPGYDLSACVSVMAPDFALPSTVAVNAEFQSFLFGRYPHHSDIYTDGSQLNTGSVSAAIYVRRGGVSVSWLLNPHHTVMGAELFAILQALRYVAGGNGLEDSRVVILSDSKSALHAILKTHQSSYRFFVHEIQRRLTLFSGRVQLQWVPAHCGIDGNEVADSCAKLGHNNLFSARTSLNYEELVLVLKRTYLHYWTTAWRVRVGVHGKGEFLRNLLPEPCRRYDIPGVSRQVNCVISRLRIGHVGVNQHLFRFNRADSPLCSECHVMESIQHFLLDCPRYEQARVLFRARVTSLGVPFDVTNTLGCGQDQSNVTRCKVLRALATYLGCIGRVALL